MEHGVIMNTQTGTSVLQEKYPEVNNYSVLVYQLTLF